jgi:phage terminase large subunit-like protein
VQSARWLPPGAWQACRATYDIAADEALVLGVDIGGSRSASAVVGCVADDDGVRVACVEVWQGADSVLAASAYVRKLLQTRNVREVVFDPMRFSSEALRLEQEFGVPLVEWNQSEVRMTKCSENLHRLVVEGRLRHPGVHELDLHVANAIAKPTPRGWRLVKSSEVVQVDAVIALAMSAERAEYTPPVVQVLGWL